MISPLDPHLAPERVSTGLPRLDTVLDGLRLGDNVVWRVESIDDYRHFVTPFVATAAARGRSIIYLRYGRHAPLVAPGLGIQIVDIDALRGFEAFTRHVYQLITDHGRGAFYVFDCLSDLLSAWATDLMVGNLFQVICPYLYELDTVAYFALRPTSHSHRTMSRIRETTQVLIDVRRAAAERYVQPVKVWQRQSPTMFLPHIHDGDQFRPVIDSSDATRLHADLERRQGETSQRQLDYWDRLFLDAAEVATHEAASPRRVQVLEQLYQVVISRDPRIVALARRYLTLDDLIAIRARMIGTGYIGGKAVGMLLARRILIREEPDLWGRHLDPHDSFYLGSDVYYSYLVHNGWWPRIMRQRTADGYFSEAQTLREDMLQGRLPEEVRLDLERMLDYFGQYPILVRSSSLLEDGFGNAFAGKYESLFRVNQGPPEQRLAQLEEAICRVFASTMGDDALVYRQQRGLADLEEPMALLLQRVNGRYHGGYYFPDAAGVGVSRNTFVWEESMDPAAGMVRLVMGLGTRAVDRIEGDHACVVALDQPHKRPFRDQDDAGRFSQHDVDVLDIAENRLRALPLRQLVRDDPDLPLRWCAELDRDATQRARAHGQAEPVWRLTFAPLLGATPFVPLMRRLLAALETAYDYPVDIEFTVHLGDTGEPSFNLVQCRPLQTLGLSQRVALPDQVPPRRLFFASNGHFMGGNIDQPIAQVICVDGPAYSALTTTQKFAVARLIGRLNRRISARDQCPTLLIGPGRWGTSSPELGVPIRFGDISRVAVIVEVAELGDGLVPDLSFGSHFFQDLVESQIAYVALFPQQPGSDYRPAWLDGLSARRRRPIFTDGDSTDDAVAAAVRCFAVEGLGLKVVADIVSQRLLCFQDRRSRVA
ncbi:PEP/pyruvate-binding domain-containing protein [Thioalkalicoccus limnaeus]|uniref:PEP/pyruvate-binding domain-containing protein n=1 Tax=Thioalkalicoccus limnaeus TaxID=120681 RepID=A0ABV4BBB8_9GAMM